MSYTDQTLTYAQDITVNNSLQLIDLLTPVYDGGDAGRRKDPFILKLKVFTDNSFVDLYAITDNPNDLDESSKEPVYIGTIQTDEMKEIYFDVSDILGVFKTIQFRLIGLVSDFALAYLTLDFGFRPEQMVYYKINLADLGIVSPNKKRIRVWPITLEVTNDDIASITPIIDGVEQTALMVQSSYPQTFNYQFTEDQIGIDFDLVIRSCCPFELYKIHPPDGVQVFPIGKKFDQVGPTEFFRFGKLRRVLVRLVAFGGTEIPFRVFFQDVEVYSGTLLVVDGAEDVYEIPIPRTVAGTVTRFELGPTDFEFHRYYVQMQTVKSGRDTELEWVPMTDNFQSYAFKMNTGQ